MNSKDRKHRTGFSAFVRERARPGYKKIIGQLNRWWATWNQDFFGSKMVVPYILLAEPTHTHSIGQYATVGSFGAKAEIRIRPSIIWGTHRLVKAGAIFEHGRLLLAGDILLHEMIHQWQHEIIHKTEDSQAGHGPRFRDKCNEIGKCLQLPAVRIAKARGKNAKLPSCSSWPHNVRPPEFYRNAVNQIGLSPLGRLCRCAREYSEYPDDRHRDNLLLSAVLYAESLKDVPSPR
jgi:hypothetical protein